MSRDTRSASLSLSPCHREDPRHALSHSFNCSVTSAGAPKVPACGCKGRASVLPPPDRSCGGLAYGAVRERHRRPSHQVRWPTGGGCGRVKSRRVCAVCGVSHELAPALWEISTATLILKARTPDRASRRRISQRTNIASFLAGAVSRTGAGSCPIPPIRGRKKYSHPRIRGGADWYGPLRPYLNTLANSHTPTSPPPCRAGNASSLGRPWIRPGKVRSLPKQKDPRS